MLGAHRNAEEWAHGGRTVGATGHTYDRDGRRMALTRAGPIEYRLTGRRPIVLVDPARDLELAAVNHPPRPFVAAERITGTDAEHRRSLLDVIRRLRRS